MTDYAILAGGSLSLSPLSLSYEVFLAAIKCTKMPIFDGCKLPLFPVKCPKTLINLPFQPCKWSDLPGE